MKHERKLLSLFLQKTDLPRELDSRRFYLRWIGADEVTIEQHRGIVSFSDEMIRLDTEQGILNFSGTGLTLEHLTDASAKVLGRIRSVSLEAKS